MSYITLYLIQHVFLFTILLLRKYLKNVYIYIYIVWASTYAWILTKIAEDSNEPPLVNLFLHFIQHRSRRLTSACSHKFIQNITKKNLNLHIQKLFRDLSSVCELPAMQKTWFSYDRRYCSRCP